MTNKTAESPGTRDRICDAVVALRWVFAVGAAAVFVGGWVMLALVYGDHANWELYSSFVSAPSWVGLAALSYLGFRRAKSARRDS